jgi:CRISPR-associated endonuclease/helicase Cas3
MSYDDLFAQATGHPPFPYQRRLAQAQSPLPPLLHIPTGAGKTAAVILAWLWRRRFAEGETRHEVPRRLVYCLPMRVLVEQTRDAAVRWLHRLGLLAGQAHMADDIVLAYEADAADARPVEGWAQARGHTGPRIAVHVLMGGEEADDWDLYPEREAILIGTLDMLLSRALNRGYGMSCYRWPMHFGLLNSDCVWVLDEVQLMGAALATTAQLHAFRETFGTLMPVQSLWMSATLRPDWLATVDYKETVRTLTPLTLGSEDRADAELRKRLEASKRLKKADVTAADPPAEDRPAHPPGAPRGLPHARRREHGRAGPPSV